MDAAEVRGREAYEARAWGDAFEALSQASTEGELGAEDVERLALSAGLTGHEDACIAAFERLHQLRLEAGDVPGAARAAFWASMRLFSLGEMARGGGWLGRAQRLVQGEGHESVERGYLKLPLVFRLTAAGNHVAARAAAAEAAEIGAQFRDADLHALGRCFEGRALIRQGKPGEGLSLLDEAMVAVTGAEVSPLVAGLVYCGVIAACQQSYALDRAREWTRALGTWCEKQPQLVAFAGACLIHRSEILQLSGSWGEAVEEARQASRRLSHTRDSEAGNAHYQEGELHRLRGELKLAEEAYALASERGREPQPGLSLLRLAQGRVDMAAATSRRLLSATAAPLLRARFLPAHVEIMLGAGALDEARAAADELSQMADSWGMEALGAIAQHAEGAVLLAEGQAAAAIEPLRRSQEVWQRVGAPYLSARVRRVLARAFEAVGDSDGAALELEAARKIFEQLGAAPDLGSLEAHGGPPEEKKPGKHRTHNLSTRELQVLLMVAAGKTNRGIAEEIHLSERTIDRHVSNIFAKLNVATRAAATAWAYEHDLVG